MELTDEIIRKAAYGNLEAVTQVLMYFKDYITELSREVIEDENGDRFLVEDEDVQTELMFKMLAILKNWRKVL